MLKRASSTSAETITGRAVGVGVEVEVGVGVGVEVGVKAGVGVDVGVELEVGADVGVCKGGATGLADTSGSTISWTTSGACCLHAASSTNMVSIVGSPRKVKRLIKEVYDVKRLKVQP